MCLDDPREARPARTEESTDALAISNLATRMLIDRGFDNVTVAEVAVLRPLGN
jgi:hypothetical protein